LNFCPAHVRRDHWNSVVRRARIWFIEALIVSALTDNQIVPFHPDCYTSSERESDAAKSGAERMRTAAELLETVFAPAGSSTAIYTGFGAYLNCMATTCGGICSEFLVTVGLFPSSAFTSVVSQPCSPVSMYTSKSAGPLHY
jgi:hypothetical protein